MIKKQEKLVKDLNETSSSSSNTFKFYSYVKYDKSYLNFNSKHLKSNDDHTKQNKQQSCTTNSTPNNSIISELSAEHYKFIAKLKPQVRFKTSLDYDKFLPKTNRSDDSDSTVFDICKKPLMFKYDTGDYNDEQIEKQLSERISSSSTSLSTNTLKEFKNSDASNDSKHSFTAISLFKKNR